MPKVNMLVGQSHRIFPARIRLQGNCASYEPGDVVPGQMSRGDAGLRANAVVYWWAQSLPKYLPQFDEVFPRIAARVSNCQFVFIEFGGGREITELFKARLARVFDAFGLSAADHCVFLPRLAPDRFLAALGQCDVMLDSIGWSGCNSVLESLGDNLPIVAFEGEWMG